ncbi:MAG: hypothetical protein K6G76_05235 [Lachnospiraceae bacterium]|nr:hypothetical protein [Lachnospiraceae bacterium]
MNSFLVQDIVITTIQVLIIIPIIAASTKLMQGGRNGLLPVFFTFGMFCYILDDLYYIVFCLLRPDERLPIAADEIAGCATLLLFSSLLEVLNNKKKRFSPMAFIFSVLFIGANIALWIAWSGEWVQDILFGLPYIYFLYLLMKGLLETKSMKKIEIAIIIPLCFIISGIEFALLNMDGTAYDITDLIAYFLMFSIAIWLIIKCIQSLYNEQGNYIYLTFTLFLCTLLILYASEDFYYSIALDLNTLSLLIMYIAFKKELAKDDIR